MARPKLYENAAARVAAHRERHNTKTLSVQIPAELMDGLNEYMKFKNLTKDAVITKLLQGQLLRKR